ncbi:hypothetical protein SKAU_G00296380 [Synaphobranchus kaupii]|uniref:Uncharacterized protein n=1 Tax=Synaphobranchus kaupii TaxID=118154 RepID=A0A9Q1IKP0_SYNKA|nr:hypothetical protein SKAU_G00296380 [Synaphobranchus kaupii]
MKWLGANVRASPWRPGRGLPEGGARRTSRLTFTCHGSRGDDIVLSSISVLISDSCWILLTLLPPPRCCDSAPPDDTYKCLCVSSGGACGKLKKGLTGRFH